MEFVVVGKVISPFGIKGEIKVLPIAPEEFVLSLQRIFFKKKGGDYLPFEVESTRRHGSFVLLKLKAFSTPEEVEQFKGAHIFLPREELPPLGEDEFYSFELVGMEVITDKGRKLGKVDHLKDFGVYDMLILEGEKIIIPFVSDIVLNVDRKKGIITVKEDLILI